MDKNKVKASDFMKLNLGRQLRKPPTACEANSPGVGIGRYWLFIAAAEPQIWPSPRLGNNGWVQPSLWLEGGFVWKYPPTLFSKRNSIWIIVLILYFITWNRFWNNKCLLLVREADPKKNQRQFGCLLARMLSKMVGLSKFLNRGAKPQLNGGGLCPLDIRNSGNFFIAMKATSFENGPWWLQTIQ